MSFPLLSRWVNQCLFTVFEANTAVPFPHCSPSLFAFCPQPSEKGMLLGRVWRDSFYSKETLEEFSWGLETSCVALRRQPSLAGKCCTVCNLKSFQRMTLEINTEEWDLFIISRWDCAALKAVEIILLCWDHTAIISQKERKFFHGKVEIELIKNPNWIKFCRF